ncbi:ribosomal protein S18 acetylase RimI-like enzyme [Saccharothrix ecbatanensis]|uniref:Ribosomal protein S18 acetylase RimI-like enzyme n=1 Tax=Saccharothrix ecbatanensis TaxID=1105145 RepID=A0A7W9HI85_9PSEU|nr:GNAT family N-acetyltransferase [Saccharothrix ecbatanensis]MBB5802431.1 ribosomal protein S18 acetylase RimI-like enzyme [Saccharothrix ecbatanensis]
MIVPLDLTDDTTAEAVHRIALLSYAVEAELIGSTGIPALHESVDDIRRLPLRWLGGYVDGELVAFVGYAKVDGVLDIDRLCVAPSHFRLGFARRLVEEVLAEGGPAIVSTGAANAPAIALYESLGFRVVDTVVVDGGLRIARFGHPGSI